MTVVKNVMGQMQTVVLVEFVLNAVVHRLTGFVNRLKIQIIDLINK